MSQRITWSSDERRVVARRAAQLLHERSDVFGKRVLNEAQQILPESRRRAEIDLKTQHVNSMAAYVQEFVELLAAAAKPAPLPEPSAPPPLQQRPPLQLPEEDDAPSDARAANAVRELARVFGEGLLEVLGVSIRKEVAAALREQTLTPVPPPAKAPEPPAKNAGAAESTDLSDAEREADEAARRKAQGLLPVTERAPSPWGELPTPPANGQSVKRDKPMVMVVGMRDRDHIHIEAVCPHLNLRFVGKHTPGPQVSALSEKCEAAFALTDFVPADFRRSVQCDYVAVRGISSMKSQILTRFPAPSRPH